MTQDINIGKSVSENVFWMMNKWVEQSQWSSSIVRLLYYTITTNCICEANISIKLHSNHIGGCWQTLVFSLLLLLLLLLVGFDGWYWWWWWCSMLFVVFFYFSIYIWNGSDMIEIDLLLLITAHEILVKINLGMQMKWKCQEKKNKLDDVWIGSRRT